jgi:O-antigen/teichoic acid export membrane protein
MNYGGTSEPTDRPSDGWRTDTFVAVATVGANVLGYGFNLVMSHVLGPSGFGEFSALLGVALIASVPGTALQAFIARRIAQRGDPSGDGRLIGQASVLGLGVGLGALAAAPALRPFLHVGSWLPLIWLAVLLVPTTVAFGCQGVLQGRRRFHALGVLLVLVQAARLVAGCVAAVVHGGISVAFAVAAVLTLAVVAVAVSITARPDWRGPKAPMLTVLTRDAAAVLGVLLLTNLDLFLARHYLPHHEAGLYAGGNLVTKAAFWGPSFVATISYPLLTQPDRRAAALRRGATMLGALCGLGVGLAAIGSPLVSPLLGHAYRTIADQVWLFAAEGALLAVVLFGVYAGLAVHDRRLAVLVWIVTVVESVAVVLWWHHTITQILTTVVIGSLTLAVSALLLEGATWHRLVARRGRATS